MTTPPGGPYVEQGVDYSVDHPTPGQLVNHGGLSFVFRYLNPSPVREGKELTPAEAQALWDNGFSIGLYYETAATAALGGRVTAQAHAAAAAVQLHAVGFPSGWPVHFAVDMNPTPAQMEAKIVPYFEELNALLPEGMVSAYGPYTVIRDLAARGLINTAVQTAGWSNGNWSPFATVRQYQNGVHIGAGIVDLLGATVADIPTWSPQMEITLSPATVQEIATATAAAVVNQKLGSGGPTVGVALQSGFGYAKDTNADVETIKDDIERPAQTAQEAPEAPDAANPPQEAQNASEAPAGAAADTVAAEATTA